MTRTELPPTQAQPQAGTRSNFIVRRVAVLGAGVMGAQIAAHLVNAKVPVTLFDLPAKDKDGEGPCPRPLPRRTASCSRPSRT